MYPILKAEKLADKIYLMVVEAPRVARACEPGEFVIVKMGEEGERIPLTICDFDRQAGTITIVFQTVGASTEKMSTLKAGDAFHDFVGPLGNPSEFIHENIDLQALNRILSEENILAAIKDTVPRVWSLLAESLNILFSILASFIILLYVVFILLDYEAIAEGWLHLLPNKYRTFASNLVRDVQDGMNKYFRGQALVAFCVGILFSIGFLIIDFPMAIALGLFIGALNMVPYLQIIGFFPTVLLAILKAADTGENFWIIIACALAVFAVVQIIQDTFLVPKIMGKITGLNPAIILLSLSIWGSLMGMLGMIIALPLTTLMLSYYQRFIINKEKIKYDEVEITDNQETNHKEIK